ncbi:MAG TPA: OsmC family protein [Ferruginibacter sp.]|nr:osmotically inducible protein C [Chitinophagaceae bacterium]HRI24167.1 OsmC family protein [Ferruginibacter sp.]
MTTHNVNTVFNQHVSFTADIDGHKITMDDPTDESSDNSGPSPKRLMLAALAGCTGIDIVSILHKMKVEFSQFSINVHAALTNEHPKYYNLVKITYKIKLAEEDKPKMIKAVSLSTEKYCGVFAMFKAFAKMDTEIDYL